MKKSVLCILLALALTLAALAGCSGKGDPSEAPAAEPPAETPAETPEEPAPEAELPDYADLEAVYQKYLGHSPDDAVVTINGKDLPYKFFVYWAVYMIDYYYKDYSIDWDAEYDAESGQTVREYFLNSVTETAESDCIARLAAEDYGFKLTSSDEQEVQDEIESNILSAGARLWDAGVKDGSINESDYTDTQKKVWELENGETEFYKELASWGIDLDTFKYMCESRILSGYLFDYFFSEASAEREDSLYPDEDNIREYIDKYDIYYAKHIFLYTVDPETKEPLSDEEIAAAKEKADDIYSQLQAADDPAAKFDELMKEHSEDDLTTYPNGYLYKNGAMIEGFQTAVEKLEFDEMSEVVQSEYGYHIILRLDPYTDELVSEYCDNYYSSLLLYWLSTGEVENAALYDELDIEGIYSAITELRGDYGYAY